MNTKKQIIAAGMEVFVANGFQNAPITKIINTAKVSNGSFFYHFKTKEQLIDAIYQDVKAEIYDYLNTDSIMVDDPLKRLFNIFVGFVSWGQQNYLKHQFIQIFYQSPYVSNAVKIESSAKFSFIKATIASAKAQQQIIDQDTDLIFKLLDGNISALISYLQINPNANIETLSQIVFRMLTPSH